MRVLIGVFLQCCGLDGSTGCERRFFLTVVKTIGACVSFLRTSPKWVMCATFWLLQPGWATIFVVGIDRLAQR
ncbi:hypothetical protein UI24_07440 [Mycobacteroides franklinii]|nr:hypothetical protein [Mycobacteroides franklinii]